MSADFLQAMARSSRERVAHASAICSHTELRERALATSPAPPLQLSALGFDLIAELKLRSPALGALQQARGADISARVLDYALAGAAAISVLTEPTRFDGELEHLREAAAALRGAVPSMRKDFLVDPYQVYEARAAGAGGVLIILRMLEPAQIASLLDAVAELHLFCLLYTSNPSPYMYFCRLGALTVVGSSPEALVKLNRGYAELRPIAGTRPRADDPGLDAQLEAELRADTKENAEHVMLVDLARNDLGRVACAGSVHVEPYRLSLIHI